MLVNFIEDSHVKVSGDLSRIFDIRDSASGDVQRLTVIRDASRASYEGLSRTVDQRMHMIDLESSSSIDGCWLGTQIPVDQLDWILSEISGASLASRRKWSSWSGENTVMKFRPVEQCSTF